jgi:Ca2+-transporting ATPase
VEVSFMQEFMPTVSLSASEWMTCIGLALILPVVVEAHKAFIRSHGGRPLITFNAEQAVAPQRARSAVGA